MRVADVVECMIKLASLTRELAHELLNGLWNRVVKTIASFVALEKRVGVLSSSAQDGMIRRQPTTTVRIDRLVVE